MENKSYSTSVREEKKKKAPEKKKPRENRIYAFSWFLPKV